MNSETNRSKNRRSDQPGIAPVTTRESGTMPLPVTEAEEPLFIYVIDTLVAHRAKIITAIPIVMIVFGCFSLHGYWSSFQINFWEYISVGEVISRSVFDVFVGLSVVAFSIGVFLVLGSLKIFKKWEIEAAKKIKPGTTAAWMHKNKEKSLMMIAAFMFVFVMGAMVVFEGVTEKEVYLAVLWFVACYSAVISMIVLPVIFRRLDTETCFFIGLFIGLSPMFCVLRGASRAEHVMNDDSINRHQVSYLLDSMDGIDKYFAVNLAEYVYIGRMGGYHFLKSRTHASTVVVPEDRLSALEIWEKKDSFPQFGPFLPSPFGLNQ